MNKQYKVLCLNGQNKGKEVLKTCSYTEAEAQDKKDKLKIALDGFIYAGWCRRCGDLVLLGKEEYIENVDGKGTLHIDVFHRSCL